MDIHEFKRLFEKVNRSVFCYGPDTGMLEKFFKLKFRDKFLCVNLIKVFKDHIKTGSFKLRDLEHKFGIRRQVVKHTTCIFQIWRDWRNPSKKKAVLLCNKEDVVRLVRLTLKFLKNSK
ncbi:MAG: ribonuclease H-like domain-containing protein [Chitinophagaceae bacterium]|nr:ribonuclease H-like domain-containing protein [Chitinophagaceae bacterium]